MSRRSWPTLSLTLALAALSALPAAASPVFDCFRGHNGGLIPNPADCYFTVVFRDPGDPHNFVNRTLGCTVSPYASHCSVSFDPSALGVPAGYVAVAAKTEPLRSSYEEAAGCVYSTFERQGSTELHSYPVAFFDLAATATGSTTANPFPYAWGGDPMPAAPLTYAWSDPMPATPVTGSSYHIVALHYFDCAQP